MGAEATRNSFRAAVLRGERTPLVVTDKNPRFEGEGDALDGVRVPRSETRRGNHRGGDRHRLGGETASAVYEGVSHTVELVNLSRGGAMIRCDFAPRLWEMVELQLGDGPGLQGAVRWIKGDSIGFEFAHETMISCSADERARLLLDVIQRNFPDQVHLDHFDQPESAEEQPEEDLGNRGEKRHPLIWKGEIHYAYDSNPVRLRNVSEGGALVDIAVDYPVGAEVLLDLADAGKSCFVTVEWVYGDQAGLKFVKPFGLACLANARPDVTPHSWTVPSFLTSDLDDDSAWDENWSRSSISEIRSDLEGYLR